MQSGTYNNQLRFTPISRTISNMGTTVSYSVNPTSNINAMNTGSTGSGWTTNIIGGNIGGTNGVPTNVIGGNIGSGFNSVNTNNIPNGNFTSNQVINSQGYVMRNVVVQPSVDISETSSDVIVTACVGNLGINDMNLNVTDNSVTISGTAWTGTENVVLNRTVPLPTSVRTESVDANLQSGVLEIRCPKTEKNIRQRAIISTDPNVQR